MLLPFIQGGANEYVLIVLPSHLFENLNQEMLHRLFDFCCNLLLFIEIQTMFKRLLTNRCIIKTKSFEHSLAGLYELKEVRAKRAEIFLRSPHCAANRLQHVRSSGPGAIMCKPRAIHRALITCNMSCYVSRSTKGQLSY